MAITSFSTKDGLKITAAALAVLALAACQTNRKPTLSPTAPTPTAPTVPAPPNPTTPPPVSLGPIPGSTQDFVINVGDRVYFDFDSFDIRADAQPILEAQAGWLQRYSGVQIRIEGNADERGTREYNLALGARRANSVRDFLVSRGVSAARISTASYGKEQPIDGGTSEEAYQRNRNAHTALTAGAR